MRLLTMSVLWTRLLLEMALLVWMEPLVEMRLCLMTRTWRIRFWGKTVLRLVPWSIWTSRMTS